MLTLARKASLVSLIAGALAFTGCATRDDVRHAQQTAGDALRAAQGAQASADRAQGTADQALTAAQRAQSSADSAMTAAQSAQSAATRAGSSADQANMSIEEMKAMHAAKAAKAKKAKKHRGGGQAPRAGERGMM
jgi:hypothetical protein